MFGRLFRAIRRFYHRVHREQGLLPGLRVVAGGFGFTTESTENTENR